MSLGPHFLKPTIAPLNFANVSLMGRLITSGLREISAENLRKQLRSGIEAAAVGAGVRPVDVEKVVPMERFEALARRIEPNQKVAVEAWEDHPVESKRTGDLANLTEQKSLPVLSDSLMRLATMANANPELRMALYELSHLMKDWQALVLETGAMLDDDRVLSGAYKKRAFRRAIGGAVLVAVAVTGVVVWQRGESARRRVGAQVAAEDPCAALALDASDLAHATPDQLVSLERRKKECETKREVLAREQAERAKKEEYARQCESLVTSVKGGKAPAGVTVVPPKLAAFAERIATGKLEASDLGPDEPTFPCADTDGVAALQSAYAHAVVRSGLWIDHDDLSTRARAGLEAHKDEVSKDTRLAIAERAEKAAVDALQDTRPLARLKARRLCSYKLMLGLGHKAFCHALSK